MKNMLITGGTVFVSRFAAEFFSSDYKVHVLNRNTRPQCANVTLIEADRHALGNRLKDKHFDVILDITAYDDQDVEDLLDAQVRFGDYILISSSAVYPETAPQPFTEETPIGPNAIWGKYGADKIAAETALLRRVPQAYILRPPYLYGPGNNVYREAFVFDCAMQDRKFYLPGEGEMGLQFCHAADLCRFIRCILQTHPEQHIFNVGNPETVSVKQWVTLCYEAAGKHAEFVEVPREIEQRAYFPFYDYAYVLDVTKQRMLFSHTIPLEQGLRESLDWYQENEEKVRKKPLFAFIAENLQQTENHG